MAIRKGERAGRQLNVRLSAGQHEALRRLAARRRTPVSWLIKDYVDSVARADRDSVVPEHEGTTVAALGGAFEWLAKEPDIYTDRDGRPIGTTTRRHR